MEVKVDIEGNGSVTGDGTYETGTQVSISAIPDESNSFKCFRDGENTITDNPYIFIAGDDAVKEVTAVFYVSFEDYLRGQVAFDIPDSALNSIRINRKITKGEDVSELSSRTLRLAYADVLYWAGTMPSNITAAKDSDGGWSHQDEAKTLSITDKEGLRKEASNIYRQYGESKYTSTVTIVNLW